jgi:hypothetical protein
MLSGYYFLTNLFCFIYVEYNILDTDILVVVESLTKAIEAMIQSDCLVASQFGNDFLIIYYA